MITLDLTDLTYVGFIQSRATFWMTIGGTVNSKTPQFPSFPSGFCHKKGGVFLRKIRKRSPISSMLYQRLEHINTLQKSLGFTLEAKKGCFYIYQNLPSLATNHHHQPPCCKYGLNAAQHFRGSRRSRVCCGSCCPGRVQSEHSISPALP